MMRTRIPYAVAMIAAGVLGAGCGGSSYSSAVPDVVPVTGVTITKTSAYLVVGAEDQLVVNVLPANATERRVDWSTSNKDVVSVTAVGKITGVALGTARITVTSREGGKSAYCDVTVSQNKIGVTGVTLDETTISVATGSSRTLTATLSPDKANNPGLTWEIQPSGIANIAATGNTARITGVKIGDAKVTVTSVDNPQAFATATVHVTPIPVTGVTLGQTALTLQAGSGTADGTSVPVTATIAPSDASNQEVTWTTSDASVATLTSTAGTTVSVVAHKQGTATITVTTADGGKTATCTVKVDPPPAVNVPVVSVTVEPTNVGLEATPATTTIVRAFIQPPNATNQGIYWTTSDGTVAAISPVSGGSATANSVSGSAVIVTAGKLGLAKLTATTSEGAKQAMADVGVYMVDVEIPGNLASTFSVGSNTSGATKTWDTKLPNNGPPVEVKVGKLVYYANANGFNTAANGITIDWYAADRAGSSAKLGVPVPNAEAYVGIPAESMTPPPDVIPASLKVSVTASTVAGSPVVALIDHATKRPYAVKAMSEGPVFVFDGVEKGKQVDIIDGAGYGPRLNISHVRVEPSGTAQLDIAPPPDVTGAAAIVASATSVTLSWTNPTVADFDHVEISSPSFATTVVVAKTDSTYTFTGLTTGTSYSFTIKAVDTTKLASAGVTVNATPATVAPMVDETLVAQWCTDWLTTTTGVQLTIPPSKLAYLAPNGTNYFKGMGGNKVMFNSQGFKPTAVGGTASPGMYVAVPAALATTTLSSVKVTVTATQYQNLTTTNVALLSSTNKVLAEQIVDAGPGSGSGGTPRAYVFDGVVRNGEIRISADQQYFMITGVKVEPSTAAVQYQ
jgi:uncharacterized protein YjdB